MDLLVAIDDGRRLAQFIDKVRQVVVAEAQQELLWRGSELDEATCLRLARGKTGPLFAFVAQVCGRSDQPLSGALAEAGYRIGTAYQLADDLLDEVGRESQTGKTLGTDRKRGKYTLAQSDGRTARARLQEMCDSAAEAVASYPQARAAVEAFLNDDLLPVLRGGRQGAAVDKELTA